MNSRILIPFAVATLVVSSRVALATTHNFTLTKSGGIVSADAKDAEDTSSRDPIRKDFRHISASFKKVDFAIPMFIHGSQGSPAEILNSTERAPGCQLTLNREHLARPL